jgi:GNAT superfamily N-acetyltransferase
MPVGLLVVSRIRQDLMNIEIRQESSASLADYGQIPIAFEVSAVCDVSTAANGQFHLVTRLLPNSYIKDYDAISERPLDWPRGFDISTWAFFAAFASGHRVGGAVVAWHTPHLDMLEGRRDLDVLWDIGVRPSHRRQGVGAALFEAAVTWATAQGCRWLKVETQNVNVAACRFYAQHGCDLLAVNSGVYPELPGEIQLLWYKALGNKRLAAG